MVTFKDKLFSTFEDLTCFQLVCSGIAILMTPPMLAATTSVSKPVLEATGMFAGLTVMALSGAYNWYKRDDSFKFTLS